MLSVDKQYSVDKRYSVDKQYGVNKRYGVNKTREGPIYELTLKRDELKRRILITNPTTERFNNSLLKKENFFIKGIKAEPFAEEKRLCLFVRKKGEKLHM